MTRKPYVIVEQPDGVELWEKGTGGKLIAKLTGAQAAAHEIANAFPDLNYTNKPVYHDSELVLRLSAIISRYCSPVSGDVISRAEAVRELEKLVKGRIAQLADDGISEGNWPELLSLGDEVVESLRTLPAVQPAGGEAVRQACIEKVKEAWATRHATLEEIIAALEAVENGTVE